MGGEGGATPQEMTSTMKIENEERDRELESAEIEAFLTALSFLNEPIASFARTTGGTPEKPLNPVTKW